MEKVEINKEIDILKERLRYLSENRDSLVMSKLNFIKKPLNNEVTVDEEMATKTYQWGRIYTTQEIKDIELNDEIEIEFNHFGLNEKFVFKFAGYGSKSSNNSLKGLMVKKYNEDSNYTDLICSYETVELNKTTNIRRLFSRAPEDYILYRRDTLKVRNVKTNEEIPYYYVGYDLYDNTISELRDSYVQVTNLLKQ